MTTEVQTIHPGWEILPAEDPAGQLAFLDLASTELKRLEKANVQIRVLLGRQLLLIQSTQSWRKFPGMEKLKDWSDFMDNGFLALTGLSRETGYQALQLGRSKAIAAMLPSDLHKFPSLQHAVVLARYERQNGGAERAIINAALNVPLAELRIATGQAKPEMLEVLVQDPAVLAPLRRIVNWLKLADPDALEAFWQTLERAKLRAGDNPSDTLDVLMSCCNEQWALE